MAITGIEGREGRSVEYATFTGCAPPHLTSSPYAATIHAGSSRPVRAAGAVEEKATGSFVGRVGLHHPEGWPEPEIGWMLVRPVWGRGYAYEAANAAVRVAFDSLAWNRAVSLIAPDNARSIAVAERLGERFECELTVRGHQVALYAMEASAWRTSSGQHARGL
jgi:RimJ/RimL family protein N-acetyltransferase